MHKSLVQLTAAAGCWMTLAMVSPCHLAEADEVMITTIPLADRVSMLQGAGGNLGLCVGEDGVLLIDGQLAHMTDKILAAVAAISDQPIRFVINTHWHADHTGGNENLAVAGSVILAHENVRRRLSADQVIEALERTVPAAPPAALPILTFADAVTFHLNGQEIEVFHVDPAHTDGDAVVHFRGANVLHTGDVYFNGLYPFIDGSNGGSVDGVVAAVDLLLARVDDATQIIPGHGPLSNRQELVVYREMVATVRDRVRASIRAGKTIEETIAGRPTAEFDEAWGKVWLTGEDFTRIVYDILAEE